MHRIHSCLGLPRVGLDSVLKTRYTATSRRAVPLHGARALKRSPAKPESDVTSSQDHPRCRSATCSACVVIPATYLLKSVLGFWSFGATGGRHLPFLLLYLSQTVDFEKFRCDTGV